METGVNHEFGGSGRQVVEEADEFRGTEVAGERKSGEVVGGAEAVAREGPVEAAAEETEGSTNEAAGGGDGVGGEGKVKRATDPGDPELLAEAGEGGEDGGQQMSVLVGVEMGGLDAGGEDPFNLTAEFRVGIDLAAEERGDELANRGGLTGAADEDAMDADVEGRIRVSEFDGMFKRVAVGHQGSGGEDSVAMSVNDAVVDIASEAEVIGVDDERSHGAP